MEILHKGTGVGEWTDCSTYVLASIILALCNGSNIKQLQKNYVTIETTHWVKTSYILQKKDETVFGK